MKGDIHMKLKCRIKILMIENDLGRQEVAEYCGVTVDQVTRWSNMRSYPPVPKLWMLARLFDCKVDDLYKIEE